MNPQGESGAHRMLSALKRTDERQHRPRLAPIVAILVVSACGERLTPEQEAGRQAYGQYCALCHGDQMQGYAADHSPAIGNHDFLRVASNAFITRAIREGRPGTPMSAWGRSFGGPLSDEQIANLVAWITKDRPADRETVALPAGNPNDGAPLYARECSTCHGAAGQGNTGPSLNHPIFLSSASDVFLGTTIARGRTGTPMPAYSGRLTDQEMANVVAFIRTLTFSSPTNPPVVPHSDLPVEQLPGPEALIINPDGEHPNFTLRENRFVPSAQVAAAFERSQRMIVLDARPPSDWALAHVRGAGPFPFYDAEALTTTLPRDGTWIIAYCACPHAASGRVVDQLREAGFEHTAVLDEGIHHWLEHNYPAARGQVPATE